MQNIIDLISLIAIAALPTWSRFRVWQVRSSVLKWGSVGLAAVLVIAVSSVSALLIPGMVKQHARSTPIPDLKVEATPERIPRGKALVDGFAARAIPRPAPSPVASRSARRSGSLSGRLWPQT
jgi:hypothetical protein